MKHSTPISIRQAVFLFLLCPILCLGWESARAEKEEAHSGTSREASPAKVASTTLPVEMLEKEGLSNLFRVGKRVLSGSRPKGRDGLASIRELGVHRVVSVEDATPDFEVARELGLEYIHLPLGKEGFPPDQIESVLNLVRSSSGPIYIHCTSGRNRGPVATALAEMALEGWSPEESLAWLDLAGTTSEGLRATVRDYHPTRVARLMTRVGSAEFHEADGRVRLTSLEVRGNAWIHPQAGVPLWTLTVVGRDGEKHKVRSSDTQGAIREAQVGQARFVWPKAEPGGLAVEMTVEVRGEDLLLSLTAALSDPAYSLWEVTFPEIGPLAQADSIHSIFPYGWGVLHSNLTARAAIERVYPSAACAMPFVGVSDGKTGVYVGLEDSAGHAARFFVGKSGDGNSLSLGIRPEIAGMGKLQRFETPYRIVLTPFEGDWHEAGQIYKRIATTTPWGSVPPLAERKDIPEWLLSTDLWYLGGCHDEQSASEVLRFAEYFGVPTAAHIYNWHEIPFDDHYPEYFPAKPGFKAAVAKVQRAGVPVMPYINGRLWDPATESWKAKSAESACALNEQSKRYEEVYGSGVPLSPMCPSTELWKTTVKDLVDRLMGEVGVQAVYIDQISAAEAKRCFSEGHGHLPGGGNFWVQGYRDMLERIRKDLPEERALTTEENADPWNDLLHAFLLVNTRADGGEIVPLYPSVYAGRVISFGFQYFTGTDFEERFPLRLKLAQEFLFGAQLGWIGSNLLAEGYEQEAEFLKTLCTLRHAHRDALQFGELLPPLSVEGAAGVTWTEENGPEKRDVRQSSVLAAAWRSPEGKNKVAAVNISNDPQKVILSEKAPSSVAHSVYLPPRGAVVLEAAE
ncbi:MAG: hypothetical protein GHCLOJNM_03849 [bacterium]|nr:hypothetical protein [bacterium]